MTPVALIIKHRTLTGRRDDVGKVWLEHMAPAIAANPGHAAYFYLFDDTDPDVICAFQLYANLGASQDFLKTAAYAAYLKAVEPLLSGPPQVTPLTLVWQKGGLAEPPG